MFIKKIRVDKFKKLEHFELEFPESKILDLEKDKEMKLSVIVGENGTAKTTIFQLIINSFLESNNSKDTGDYEVNYKLEGNEYTKSPHNDFFKSPSNIVVSSYTPIDKLNLVKEFGNSKNVVLQKSNIDNQSIKKLSTRILKKFASNKFEEVYSILKYIGYEKRELYFEFSEYSLRTSYTLERIMRKLEKMNDEGYDFSSLNLNSNLKIEEKLNNYATKLNELATEKEVKKRFGFFENKLKNIMSKVSMRRNDYYEFASKYEHYILEAFFILEKFSILSKITKNYESSFKNGKRKLLSVVDFYSYPDGNQQLLRDLDFLDLFSLNLLNDVWFENNFDNEPFPISMLSSGELSMFIRFFDLNEHVNQNSIVLIDEPETHLHPKWIRGYIKTLIELLGDRRCHVIIATHSPMIVSDVTKNCIIGLKRDNHLIKQIKFNDKTLGLNYEDVLSDIFDVEDHKGEMINEYVELIEKALEIGDIDKALNIYAQIADSNTKYQLFLKIKAFKEAKGDRNV